MDYKELGIDKEEALKAIKAGTKEAVLHALGLDYTYMFNAKEQVAFRKEITDAVERGVHAAMRYRKDGVKPLACPPENYTCPYWSQPGCMLEDPLRECDKNYYAGNSESD